MVQKTTFKAFIYLILISTSLHSIVYENIEDGTTSRFKLSGSKVTNIFDSSKNTKVIIKNYDTLNNQWNQLGFQNNDSSIENGLFPNIAFDKNDTPYIVFTNSESNIIIVNKFDLIISKWIKINSTNDNFGYYPSLQITKNTNTLYLTYRDTLNENKISVKKLSSFNKNLIDIVGE